MNNSLVGQIKNLNWAYRNKPLFENLEIDLPKGVFISIIGPNGSGKTTLLRHLLRLLSTKKETIIYPKGDILNYSQKELARYISYVPQKNRLEYDFTVYEVVSMARYSHLKNLQSLTKEDHLIINNALNAMKIESLANHLATELSGGEYQRMLIARALAQQAAVILLDEPVSHLDLYNQKEILKLLRELVDESKATVITVLHDLNAVSTFSDLVVMLNEGKIVATGSVAEVLTKEKIKEVYQVDVNLMENNKRPIILPRWE